MNDVLAPFPVIVQQALNWGDMDAYQHVNNTVYFRHFENARIAYFERIQWIDIAGGQGVGPILAATSCRYRLPLTYPDTIRSATRIRELRDSGFLMDHLIWSDKLQAVAAEGESRIVSYDYARASKAQLPEEVRGAILALEKHLSR